jgi:hypothetical protein
LLQQLAENNAFHRALNDTAQHVVDRRLIAEGRAWIIIAALPDLVAWRLCEACLDVEAASIMLFE